MAERPVDRIPIFNLPTEIQLMIFEHLIDDVEHQTLRKINVASRRCYVLTTPIIERLFPHVSVIDSWLDHAKLSQVRRWTLPQHLTNRLDNVRYIRHINAPAIGQISNFRPTADLIPMLPNLNAITMEVKPDDVLQLLNSFSGRAKVWDGRTGQLRYRPVLDLRLDVSMAGDMVSSGHGRLLSTLARSFDLSAFRLRASAHHPGWIWAARNLVACPNRHLGHFGIHVIDGAFDCVAHPQVIDQQSTWTHLRSLRFFEAVNDPPQQQSMALIKWLFQGVHTDELVSVAIERWLEKLAVIELGKFKFPCLRSLTLSASAFRQPSLFLEGLRQQGAEPTIVWINYQTVRWGPHVQYRAW